MERCGTVWDGDTSPQTHVRNIYYQSPSSSRSLGGGVLGITVRIIINNILRGTTQSSDCSAAQLYSQSLFGHDGTRRLSPGLGFSAAGAPPRALVTLLLLLLLSLVSAYRVYSTTTTQRRKNKQKKKEKFSPSQSQVSRQTER